MLRALSRWWSVLLPVLLAASLSTVAAAPIRLDDLGTHVVPGNVQMKWRDAVAGGDAQRMEAEAGLAVRLDTRAFAGRRGRIFLVFGEDGVGPLVMRWVTRGRMLPGTIRPGERILVFNDVLPGPTLEDRWLLRLSADGTWVTESRLATFHFELDLDPS